MTTVGDIGIIAGFVVTIATVAASYGALNQKVSNIERLLNGGGKCAKHGEDIARIKEHLKVEENRPDKY